MTDEEDRQLAQELIDNEKERAEHVMLVDLERNDLGRVCKYGTVEVNEFMAIEKYSHVMHIVSNVQGVLAENKSISDIIEATFPGGTITGAPKVRTMEIIEELEPVRRSVYTGSIGWIGYDGEMELNISIRTMIAKEGMAEYIRYLFKTVRKFYGEAIVVTQELGDIIGNEVVKDSIISNSDTIVLLDQSKFRDHYDEIGTLLSINQHERKKIFTINQLDNTEGRDSFKEVYIRRGNSGEVYGVEVSLHQYLTYTTEKPEKAAVEIYTSHYGGYESGIDRFVSDWKQSGVALDRFFALINERGVPLESKFQYQTTDQ
jgi:hypothetical protein